MSASGESGRSAMVISASAFAPFQPFEVDRVAWRRLDLYREPFVIVAILDERARILLEAAFPGLVETFDGVCRPLASTPAVFSFLRAGAFGTNMAEGSFSISNPKSAEISSSTNNLAASGAVLDSGRALSRFVTSSFWFTALN